MGARGVVIAGLAGLLSTSVLASEPAEFALQLQLSPSLEARTRQLPTFEARSPVLQQTLISLIETMKQQGKIDIDEDVAFLAYDIKEDKVLISLNKDKPVPSASRAKLNYAALYFTLIAEGKKQDTQDVRSLIEKMFHGSPKESNSSTNNVMDLLGGPKHITNLLSEKYGNIFRSTLIVQPIPTGGAEYKNSDTLSDYARLLFALYHGEIPHSHEILDLIDADKKKQRVRLLPASFKRYFSQVYHKTGSTAIVCTEGSILHMKERSGRTRDLIVVASIHRSSPSEHYFTWITSRVDALHELSAEIPKYYLKTSK